MQIEKGRKKAIFCLLLIAAFALLAYANSFHNGFLYDDEHLVQKNLYIRDFSHLKDIFTKDIASGAFGLYNFYRPAQILLYSVIYRIFGLNVFGYHLANFLLHLGNAFLFYFLTLVLFKNIKFSLAASLLFAVHPVHTEAITYISGTADPLAMFFGLLSLLFYLKSRRAAVYYLLSLIFFAAALASKETMVVLPALIIAVDLYRRGFSARKLLKYVPYFALVSGYALARVSVFNFTRSINLFRAHNIYTDNLHYRLFTFLASLPEYYKLLFLPVNLKYDRRMVVFTSLFNPQVLISFILLPLLLYFAYRSFRNDRVVFLGVVWFFIALAPVTGIVPINGFVMEHWLYPASAGFFMIIAYYLAKLKRKIYIAILLAVAASFSCLTIQRNKDWKDPVTFYNKILKHNPDVARVRNNLGMAYADKGRLEEAEEQYKIAIILEDRYSQPHHNLAQIYLRKGMINEGVSELKKAIAIDDSFIYSHIALRSVYERLGMRQEAQDESAKIDKIISGFEDNLR